MDKTTLLTPPLWFTQAIQAPRASFQVKSGDRSLHGVAWPSSDPRLPALLLVHGYLANTHWWDWIAPFFSQTHRVYAFDLSGMGDSERRDSYHVDLWRDEIAAVAAHIGEPVLLLGHSFGGFRCLEAIQCYPEMFSRGIIVDSYIHFKDYPLLPQPRRQRTQPSYFSTQEQAIERYRLMPSQQAPLYALNYLARNSLRREADGWSWNFDELHLSAPRDLPDSTEMLRAITQPVHYIHGEYSAIASAARMARVSSLTGTGASVVEIPAAHHHIMLDQPLSLVAAIRGLLAHRRD